MLDQGTAGFSLHAVVACTCQLGSDISQGTSKGSTRKCIHVQIFPRFPRQNKMKLIKENSIKKSKSPVRQMDIYWSCM